MAARSREQLLDDKKWQEVRLLNSYAVFIGYITMGIKGLGFLVLTWTTVVLLGGFVSTLHKKDFWCLTFITLVQTAGIFDVTLNEKLSYIASSVTGWMTASSRGLVSGTVSFLPWIAQLLFIFILVVVQLVLLVIVMFSLGIVYFFGILISGGISLWRLREHDYQGSFGGEEVNLMPAMETLYYLALLQAVLFCYKFILGRTEWWLVKYMSPEDQDLGLIFFYLQETIRGCEKDPSFANGRNFVTHAVDMIASNSPVDCITGVEMLHQAMEIRFQMEDSEVHDFHLVREIVNGQGMLINHLVMSGGSSKHILQKLLEMLDSRGLHDTRTRKLAATIVMYLACDINLEQFPRGIHHISSLIRTFEEYRIAEPYQRDFLFHEYEENWDVHARCLPPSQQPHSMIRDSYMELLEQGLTIIRRLASQENNCIIMSDTPYLLSRIMAPITLDLLHNTTDEHGAWSDIVYVSVGVMNRLATAPGETGAKLRHEMSSCQGTISTLWRILNCNECREGLRTSAILILKHLYMDTETSCREDVVLNKETREEFASVLVDIFTDDSKSINIREYAGAALSEICRHGGVSVATTVIETGGGDVIDTLTEILVMSENEMWRRAAALILEQLCMHYTNDDEYLCKLKKAIADLMPEMLGILLCSKDETHTSEESRKNGFAIPETDIESQSDATTEIDEQDKEEKVLHEVMEATWGAHLTSYLISLCGTACNTFIGESYPDLAPHFLTPSFVNNLQEIVVKHSDLTVDNLLLLESVGKMVIVMMKHSSRFHTEDFHAISNLIWELSRVSQDMQDLDHSMIFSSGSSRLAKHERRTLASIVKEAKQSFELGLSGSVSC